MEFVSVEWGWVYSKRVTLAEVNESTVTVTEECVLMIPAPPLACVRVGSTHTP